MTNSRLLHKFLPTIASSLKLPFQIHLQLLIPMPMLSAIISAKFVMSPFLLTSLISTFSLTINLLQKQNSYKLFKILHTFQVNITLALLPYLQLNRPFEKNSRNSGSFRTLLPPHLHLKQ
ncbi:hypothetical protein NPIL_129321 [Nephila pilipes]|uniref:Uncharacterized protein n=1 Tax=Nephila pilipes TaxID=299642 RepID=A0A8X6NAU1_NEPPI|nr:hypothetical protein NPIL_129321 [Nephila pilipes]